MAVAVALGGVSLGACGDDEAAKPAPKKTTLSKDDIKGVTEIGRAVQKYCFEGGARANIERDVDSLKKLLQQKPNAVYRAPGGNESTVRQVVSAVADQLEGCGAPIPARDLRTALKAA